MSHDSSLPNPSTPKSRSATVALLLGTLFWGFGFTWAKEGGEALNAAAGMTNGSPVGPILLLVWRFGVAAVLWLIAFPASRRGWNWRSVGRSMAIGSLLGTGLIAQHLGLDRTSPAVTAFLTSLTILFVPLLMTLVLRRPPPGTLWVGVAVATVGVWLMTGAAPTGFGLGELLGLSSALIFSAYILVVNAVNPRDTAWRMAAGQFIVAAVLMAVALALVPGGLRTLDPATSVRLMCAPGAWLNCLLLTGLTTFGAYGLLNVFQPRVDPTRAALIYLVEPIFAAGYAWVAVDSTLAPIARVGAGLILAANVVVELWEARAQRLTRETATPPAAEIPV